MTKPNAIFWFRNDLRLYDNHALSVAAQNYNLIPIYILDTDQNLGWQIGEAQKWWLHHSLKSLQNDLAEYGVDIIFKASDRVNSLLDIATKYKVEDIFWNKTHLPENNKEDIKLKEALAQRNIQAHEFNCSLLIEPATILNKSGSNFKVFTAFWRECLKHLPTYEHKAGFQLYDIPKMASNKHMNILQDSDTIESWNLLPTKPDWSVGFKDYWQPGESGARLKLNIFVENALYKYHDKRDIPSVLGTSRLSPHLRFGEISIRKIWNITLDYLQYNYCSEIAANKYLAELGWREFSYYLLHHNESLPYQNFNSIFDKFPWRDDPLSLRKWQTGNTGYPIVDAGMRELWHTGWMHNRVRMIVASFLTKHLLISWQHGAKWFLDTLLDADLASNSSSWQWVAGCGADAAPYFRIFNPITQGEKFDPEGNYIKKWVPELTNIPTKFIHSPWQMSGSLFAVDQNFKQYPMPMIDHIKARERAMDAYEAIKKCDQ